MWQTLSFFFFFFKQKTAYEILAWLEFRRVLFRSWLQLDHHHHHHPILIRFYPCKWGWPDIAHPNSNLSNSHSPSRLIQGILLLQTNTLALLLHLCLPCLLWHSHFLLPFTSNSNTFLKTCPSSLLVPSHSICLCHLNHCFLPSTRCSSYKPHPTLKLCAFTNTFPNVVVIVLNLQRMMNL